MKAKKVETRAKLANGPIEVKFKLLSPGAILPAYQTEGAAGADVHALLPRTPTFLAPGETRLIPTGIAIEIPVGYEVQVRSRSGLSSKGIVVTNSPGTIDSDYRGELLVLLTNIGEKHFELKRHDRIAQLVLAKYDRIEWKEVSELSPTKRGCGGGGSTGI